MNLKFDKIFLWTDSTIVLAWLRADCNRFQTFVANRISQIQSLTKQEYWHHVRSNDNPADILSRGTDARSLGSNNLWWNGPQWLCSHYDKWPISNNIQVTDLPEQKRIVKCVVIDKTDSIFERFSNYTRLIRTTAFCLRFIKNCKRERNKRLSGPLSSEELQQARDQLIKLVQRQHFKIELQNLSKSNAIDKSSKLLRLSPFVHNEIVRVGGRLRNSSWNFSQKHPIVLPADHVFTKLLIVHTHVTHFHAGALATMNILRQQFWILNARNKIRHLIYKCITCFKVKPRNIERKMGDLPSVRITSARPFQECGVDYGGPFYIKSGVVRSKIKVKVYVALFVCMATRAVHIELVSDLTTNAFLAALKRLMARRGKVRNIYSDNGSNFKGAANELNSLYKFFKEQSNTNSLIDLSANQGTKWQFIPPRTPHFGGLWEAGIKSIKHHLKRVVGEASLTYEEMYTILVQIEAILNSRPLTPLSHDPSDLVALTPGHLLIGDTFFGIPEPDILDIKITRLDRWQYLERARQHFWKRWSKEYISSLQQRLKWPNNDQHKIEVGQLVLVKEENLPPLQWLLGRIIELHPGSDGITRVVSIKTINGIIKRSVNRLCALPIEKSC